MSSSLGINPIKYCNLFLDIGTLLKHFLSELMQKREVVLFFFNKNDGGKKGKIMRQDETDIKKHCLNSNQSSILMTKNRN